jgi:hypothetical protein
MALNTINPVTWQLSCGHGIKSTVTINSICVNNVFDNFLTKKYLLSTAIGVLHRGIFESFGLLLGPTIYSTRGDHLITTPPMRLICYWLVSFSLELTEVLLKFKGQCEVKICYWFVPFIMILTTMLLTPNGQFPCIICY